MLTIDNQQNNILKMGVSKLLKKFVTRNSTANNSAKGNTIIDTTVKKTIKQAENHNKRKEKLR